MNIVVLDKPIREVDGLYCLNDLHRASGAAEKHKPARWLRNQETIDLIEEITKDQKWALEQNQQVIKTIQGGNRAGTFACRELVLAYATWISPAFFLTVLRTFDALHSADVPAAPALVPCDVDALPPLRKPRDVHEARWLAMRMETETLLFSRLNSRLSQMKEWLPYWRDVFIDELMRR